MSAEGIPMHRDSKCKGRKMPCALEEQKGDSVAERVRGKVVSGARAHRRLGPFKNTLFLTF